MDHSKVVRSNRRSPSLKAGVLGAITAVAGLALLSGGCGGSSSSSSARIRAVNTVSNGGAATMFVNSGTANGTQNFGEQSSYLYLTPGTSTFSFTLSGSTGTSYAPIMRPLNDGNAYTAAIVGRADVFAPDPRAPRLVLLTDDHGAPPSGTALVRILNSAPDAGTIAVTAGGQTVSAGTVYGDTLPYTPVTAGSTAILVKGAASGTSLVTQTINLAAGHAYTLAATEPTVTPTPSFGVLVLSDDL